MPAHLKPAPEAPSGGLQPWETRAADAIGDVIEFWGFKRNQGRVWALLYLRGRPLSAREIQEELDLSKGAVSMIVREMEGWGVIRRARAGRARAWGFEAEQDLLAMVRRVLASRERPLVARVLAELSAAEEVARAAGSPPESVDRLTRMRRLAELIGGAVEIFLRTATLDLHEASGVLRTERPGDGNRVR